MKIVIVGAGPSGICASIQIKKNNPTYEVILIDKEKEIGSRIKISGNGKCNLGNINASSKYYNDEKLTVLLLNHKQDYFSLLDEAGLSYFSDEEGRIYPTSESSISVIHAYKNLLNKYQVEVKTSTKVKEVIEDNKIKVVLDNEIIECDKCVLAIGGLSNNNDKIIYNSLIKPLTNDLIPFTPSLTPISTTSFNKEMEGKRVKAKIQLVNNNQVLKEEIGELLFKKDGVSGICIFNISSYLARLHLTNYSSYKLRIDLLPNIDKDELDRLIKIDDSYINVLNYEIARYIKENKINPKEFELGIRDLYELKYSQVSSGGVNLNSLNNNFSLKTNPNIYIIGEATNIDGECGGFNIEINSLMGLYLGNNI